MAVLSALAENPDRVKDIFITQEVNKSGIYLLKIFVNGVASPVIVDDFIATRHNLPCYAQSRDEELWVILLEKAWAKLYGSYARIAGGFCCHAASQLLGIPSVSFLHSDQKNNLD